MLDGNEIRVSSFAYSSRSSTSRITFQTDPTDTEHCLLMNIAK